MGKIELIQRKRRQEKKESKKEKAKASKTTNQIKDMDVHRISFEEFYKRYDITEEIAKTGLTSAEAQKRNQE